jgi:hypothetical protein
VAIIGDHPQRLRSGRHVVEYFVRSQSFEQEFPNFAEAEASDHLRRYCGRQRAGPLGTAEILVRDKNDTDHIFHFETFSTIHSTLTLGQHIRARPIIVAQPGILAG